MIMSPNFNRAANRKVEDRYYLSQQDAKRMAEPVFVRRVEARQSMLGRVFGYWNVHEAKAYPSSPVIRGVGLTIDHRMGEERIRARFCSKAEALALVDALTRNPPAMAIPTGVNEPYLLSCGLAQDGTLYRRRAVDPAPA